MDSPPPPSKPLDYGTLDASTPAASSAASLAGSASSSPSGRFRQDVLVWAINLALVAALIGAIFGIGAARGWDADSGYTHNTSATSAQRFWPEPMVAEPGVPGRYGTDATGRWYYWKLAPDQVTALTRGLAWLAYTLHQLCYWFGLYRLQSAKMAQRAERADPRERPTAAYSSQLGAWNWYLVGVNVAFHLVHLGQTHWTYDALAQDVSISSSQSSVIMLLIFIMVIEYRDRGLFFGWPSRFDKGRWSVRLRLPYDPMLLVRKYHGYAFAWAAIYTFWYHPMENTWGHALGFFHTYVLLLQGSLAYTPFHLNKYWRFMLEVWVTGHGGVVAAQTGGPDQLGTKLWPMFVFGFLLIVVLTQLFGLPFWRRIPVWTRFLPFVAYLGVVIYMYSWIPDAQGRVWVRMQEVIRIPGIYYLYFFVVWGWTLLLLWADCRCRWPPADAKVADADAKEGVGPGVRVACLAGIVLIYALFVGVSTALQVADLQVNMIMLMILLTGLFILGCCAANILFRIVFDQPWRQPAASATNQVAAVKWAAASEKKAPVDAVDKAPLPDSDTRM